ncbi:hypothetical protein [Streptomyces eurythermus]|uniref:hypothetical protein n=1 Tax=Streptomyces eurythermus TaxID=42237 RepID=UPI0033C5F4D8
MRSLVKKAIKGGAKVPHAPKVAPPVPGPALYGAEGTQLGKKWGKHAVDYGKRPGDAAARQWYGERIAEVRRALDEVRQGAYRPGQGGADDYWFYKKDNDLLLTKGDGGFVSMFPLSGPNKWYENATTKY